jgi:bacteriorhodopsin
MDTLNLITSMLVTQLEAGDPVGFTFFTGYMSMFAASVFFFFERGQVDGKWKTSLLVSGLITMIAAVHYFYMRGYYLEVMASNPDATMMEASPTQFRYIDWTLTVPLMCVEFYLLLKPYGAKMLLLWKMIGYSVLMLVAGYIGESIAPDQTVLWGIISTVGYGLIVYEVAAGSIKQLAEQSDNPEVAKAVRLLRNFVVVGWAIYPIGYMLMPGNLFQGLSGSLNIDLIYNIGDAVNKIGFGLVVYNLAVTSSSKKTVAG